MQKAVLVGLALAGVFLTQSLRVNAQFADGVMDYDPGTGAGVFNNPQRALGAPTSVLSYGPVDPFNAPYSTNDVVTIGTGGALTLQLDTPIRDEPGHLFGLDFIIFGNAGFVITNDFDPVTYQPIGEPATDGSLYGADGGITRVSVSADGLNFYRLNPLLAPNVDALFPTDSAGDSTKAVNPVLSNADFAGLDLTAIRELYDGSAGGTGFDLAWAQEESGQPANLSEARYVRIEVLSDNVELDAVAVVPEPSAAGLLCLGLAALSSLRYTRQV